MKVKILVGLAVVLAANSAHAFTDVCTLANSDMTRIEAPAAAIAAYKSKIANECAVSEKYQQMIMKAQSKYGIRLEQISLFQGLRYIERSYYDGSKYSNTPLPLTYQLFKLDYQKPLEQRSSVIWDGFQTGIRQLDGERARVAQGGRFEIPDLERVHAGFYQLSNEIGDFAHEPYAGKLKPPYGNDKHWWKLEAEKVESTKKLVDAINEYYSDLGVIGTPMDRLYGDPYVNDVISVRQAKDGDGMALYGGDTKSNPEHLAAMLKLVNSLLARARQGQHMVVKGQVFTPGELAFMTQQFIVQIHPFSEGNGRVSRFVQELILTLFSLPPGASGDLMTDDVLVLHAPYYQRAMLKTYDHLLAVDQCLERVYPEATKPSLLGTKGESGSGSKNESKKPPVAAPAPISLLSVDQSKIEYDCRLLK